MTLELAICGAVVCAGASFFFALAETALFSLGKWRAQQLAEASPERGRKVLELLQEPHSLLATLVFGNTFANAGLIAVCFWAGLSGRWLLGWTVAGTLAFILIGCEVIPKTLAVRAAEAWSLRVAGFVQLLQRMTGAPQFLARQLHAAMLRFVIPRGWTPQSALTDGDYLELFELAQQHGTLARSEKEILQGIIQLDRRTVKDAMMPRAQMACVSDESTVEELVAAARQHKHQRLPMYDETPDTIVGVLNTRTLLLGPEAQFEDAIEFPSFVPETMNLLQLFISFQRQGRGLALVLDEFGGTAGLITMEDILEEVIGELRTEGERQEFLMERVGEGRWRVSGTMRLDEFRREYPSLSQDHGVETLGGLLVHLRAVVPARGESALVDGLRLTAARVDERRVLEVLVEAVKKRRSNAPHWPEGAGATGDVAVSAASPSRGGKD